MTFLFVSAALVLMLAGCGGVPTQPDKPSQPAARTGGYYLDDGPPDRPPADLDRVPDAVPRAEPLHRFANRPYQVFGVAYTPHTTRQAHVEEGLASWYGRRFHGKKTSSGEMYDMYAMTGAHPTLPIPSYVRVTALNNGRSVVVRINDRGPFHRNRVIDLSYAAAHRLGYVAAGSTRVRVEVLDPASVDTRGEALAGGIYLQLGAFSREDNARALLDRVREALSIEPARARVVLREALHRVHLGPYADDVAAEDDRARVRARLDLNAVIVRRD